MGNQPTEVTVAWLLYAFGIYTIFVNYVWGFLWGEGGFSFLPPLWETQALLGYCWAQVTKGFLGFLPGWSRYSQRSSVFLLPSPQGWMRIAPCSPKTSPWRNGFSVMSWTGCSYPAESPRLLGKGTWLARKLPTLSGDLVNRGGLPDEPLMGICPVGADLGVAAG